MGIGGLIAALLAVLTAGCADFADSYHVTGRSLAQVQAENGCDRVAPDAAAWCRAVVGYCASLDYPKQELCFQHEVERRNAGLAAEQAADAAEYGTMMQFQQQWNQGIQNAFPRPRTCVQNLGIVTCY